MTPHTPLVEALKEKIEKERIPIATMYGGMHRLDLTTEEYKYVRSRIATETTEPDAVQNGKQNFERFPKLAEWIERLANTNCGMNLIEWTEFLFELNQACAPSSPSVQSIRAGALEEEPSEEFIRAIDKAIHNDWPNAQKMAVGIYKAVRATAIRSLGDRG